MSERITITALDKAAAPRVRAPGATTSDLPADVVERGASRLAIAARWYAIIYFAANVIGHIVAHLLAGEDVDMGPHEALFMIAAVTIAVSLVVMRVAGSGRLQPRTVVRVGLVYQVLGSLGIGLASSYLPFTQPVRVWGISFICVWITVYPLLVPTPPRAATIAAFVSASMGPLSLLFWIAIMDQPGVPIEVVAQMTWPNFLCAFLASFVARIVFTMGTDLQEARQLGSYRLEEQLGSGGMGEVWRATHRMLARPAAIKIVRPEVLHGSGDPEVILKRFEREAQVTASMRSPHTIQLYDFGISVEGRFYYVMELLDGFDCDSLVQQFGPLAPERVIHLLRQVCNSLAEAHEYDLIHRDIKPANIYVCRYGRNVDFVKVLDFGLVTSDGAREDDTKLTAENVAGGTPAFMAPEQVLGNRPVDARTDIYALGCVAYWLLTGYLPFSGGTAMETMMQQVQDAPAPPAERAEQRIPRKLEELVLACLEKDPGRRPQSAEALAAGLAACPMADSWTRHRARSWWELHRPEPTPSSTS
jgi:serine/threonine-protein kinase